MSKNIQTNSEKIIGTIQLLSQAEATFDDFIEFLDNITNGSMEEKS